MDACSPSPRGCRTALVLVLVAAALLGAVVTAPRATAAGTFYLSGSACTSSSTPTWVAGDTWVLYSDVLVDAGCVLTIEPGVTVRADPNVHLYVNGTLHADGVSGNPVVFVDNQTAVTPWAGVQFNASSQGTVTWSTFNRVQVAVTARLSSPAISNNTIVLASAGVYLDRSTSRVADNRIDGQKIGSFGIILTSADATLERNRINGTTFGIQGGGGGSVVVQQNVITNTSGAIAIGVYLDNLASATLADNVIQNVIGRDAGPGARGGTGVGILVNGTADANLTGNSVTLVRGGRGGDGASSTVTAGAAGGDGGAAAGVALGSVSTALIQGNAITDVAGNRGGNGGSSTVGVGGPGGAGGIGFALELFSSTGNVSFFENQVGNVSGGNGGTGGMGGLLSNGRGGPGADAYGIFSPGGMNASISGNTIKDLLGGAGGNSPVLGNTLPGTAGSGGNATAIIAVAKGIATIHANVIDNVTGGIGGDGRSLGGAGGNATGSLAVGTEAAFNRTVASSNRITGTTGGDGGMGGKLSGNGGNATGIGGLHVTLSMASNTVSVVQGGDGGVGIAGNQASGGGFASGAVFMQIPDGTSSLDAVETVAPGSSGGGISPPASYGVGLYFAGNASAGTRATLTNGTIAGASSFDLYVDNYTAVTTLNTTFSGSKVAIMRAGNLTVRNFLAVQGFWPDNATLVQALSILVKDGPSTVFSGSAPSGQRSWIAVTHREYINSVTPVYNVTNVSVSFGTSRFWDSPRLADMNASHTETFGMVDAMAPYSAATRLPRYETTDTFSVAYTYGDPSNGTGVRNVTLWYRQDGGAWTRYGVQSSPGTPFTFLASADGVYEFATIAADDAGNTQQPSPPIANNTWTVVDTLAPEATSSSPSGNLAGSPAAIQITFSEPMNESAVEAAFSIGPAVIGTFTWSNGSRILRFEPSAALATGTTYTVIIGTGAKDLAGNPLAQVDVFTFTVQAPPAPGFSLVDWWPLFVVLAAALGVLAFFLVRRRGAAAPAAVGEPPKPAPASSLAKPEAAIDDVFLLYRKDGILIKHETRRLRPDIDTDILSGMLTAVQQFVKDSFRGEEGEELNEMTVGQMHILIGRGKWLVLAATLTGGDIESMTAQIQKCVVDMEDHNWDRLEDWNGDMEIGKALGPYLKKLIRGEYA